MGAVTTVGSARRRPSVLRASVGGGAGEAGVAGPVAAGGPAPAVGGVVVEAEQLGEDWRWDACGECEQRSWAGGVCVDSEFAQAASESLGSDVGSWFRAGEQLLGGRPRLLAAQQIGERP